MPRNIVLCCDGTANEISTNPTNVLRLYSILEPDLTQQAIYYHPGLGTMEAKAALTPPARVVSRLLGLAFASGLSSDVADAYRFLMNHYVDGDRVFLFGFSRGAYTVRVLASLLKMFGLMRAGHEESIPYATRILTSINRGNAKKSKEDVNRFFDVAERVKGAMSRIECRPYFVGIWDTVSAVGWIENPLRVPYSANNPDIQIGRHAVAIDERRAFYRTNLWRRPSNPETAWGPKDVKQVWFAGVHSDVGGGYVESESGLSKISLEWILTESKAAGLLVRQAKEDQILGRSRKGFAPPDVNGTLHQSLWGPWHLAEFARKRHFDHRLGKDTKRMNLYRPRTIPEGALIHESVFARTSYNPRLPKVYAIEP